MLRERTISISDVFPLNYCIIIMPGIYLSWNESKKMESYNLRAQEIWFSRASGNDYLIGQNRRVLKVSFGLSKNSLEAHLSKVKRRA